VRDVPESRISVHVYVISCFTVLLAAFGFLAEGEIYSVFRKMLTAMHAKQSIPIDVSCGVSFSFLLMVHCWNVAV
jgi:hypothetical protein